MKTPSIFLILGSIIGSLVVGASANGQVGQPGYATVVRVEGMASYSIGDGFWHPLVAGRALVAGSIIRTSDNGIVDVVLGKAIDFPQSQGAPTRISQAADAPVRGLISCNPSIQQNVIRLTPDSQLAIDKLTSGDTGADTLSDTELDLQKGKIFGSVKKYSATTQYLIKLPNGIAGIRGTEFGMDVSGPSLIVSVAESQHGGMLVSVPVNGTISTVTVGANEVYDSGAGSPPAPVSAGLQSLLTSIFSSLRTTYTVSLNFDENHNCVPTSSGTGYY